MEIAKLARYSYSILRNIWSLYSEAKWLFKLGFYARAYTLAHIGFEEFAKLTVLMFVGMDIFHGKTISDEALKDLIGGKLFRDHKSKLKIAFLRLPGFDYQQSQDFIHFLNDFKNRSLYSDILEDGEMYWPGDLVNKHRSEEMLEVLENSIKKEAEELGLKKLKHLKNVTISDYVDHYNSNRQVFHSDPLTQIVPTNAGYVDLLIKLISDEKYFNAFKQTASSK